MIDTARLHQLCDQADAAGITQLTVASIDSYAGHFDYATGSGKRSRQFNFATTVHATEPVVLTEHDAYTWTNPTNELPVTDAVKNVLATWHAERRTESAHHPTRLGPGWPGAERL